MNLAQNLGSTFGKILRIDPLGKNSANGKYGIPKDNPFVNDNDPGTLAEIYAYGARNPQRFAWDSKTGTMYMADIGQGIVEEVTTRDQGRQPRMARVGRQLQVRERRRSQHGGSAERSESDLSRRRVRAARSAASEQLCRDDGICVSAQPVEALANLLLFGDNPSGEMFYVNADKLPPNGGQDAIRRILFNDKGQTKTLLELVKEKNVAQGLKPSTRADLRYGEGPDGRIFILNKWDGVIREIVP